LRGGTEWGLLLKPPALRPVALPPLEDLIMDDDTIAFHRYVEQQKETDRQQKNWIFVIIVLALIAGGFVAYISYNLGFNAGEYDQASIFKRFGRFLR
jgi:hypothetical protein